MKDFFSIPRTFFKIIGLTPFGNHSLKFVSYLQILYWFSVVDLLIALLAQGAYFIRGLHLTGNFLQMISTAACFAFGLMAWQELLMVWLNRVRLSKLIQFLDREFPKTHEKQFQFQIPKLYKDSRSFIISFSVCYLSLISAFNFTPVVADIADYWQSSEWKWNLPYLMLFPFDPRATITRYMTVYILESWAGFTAVVACLSLNLLLSAIITQVCLQLKILKNQLETVKIQRNSMEKNQSVAQLRAIVIKHGELISFCQELDNIFCVSILVNYISSSLLICLVGFEVVVGVKIYEIIKFCLFLISSLMQTFALSYFGQQIIDHVRRLY